MSRIGHVGPRHPLCPQCGYDLVATVARGGRTCPECGHGFELDELPREVRPDDWTTGRGLGKVAGVLALRGAAALVVWGVLVLVVDVVAGWLVTPGSGVLGLAILIVLCVTLAIAGGMIGDRIARRLHEIAGFQSLLLPFAAGATAWTAFVCGTMLVDLLRPITVASVGVITFIGGSVATVWIVRCALEPEY